MAGSDDEADVFRPGMTPSEAAVSLLSHVVNPDGECTRSAGYSHTWMEAGLIFSSQAGTQGIFERHWTAQVPDTLDGAAVTTNIHKFVLSPEAAEDMNSSLRALGASRYYGGLDGIQRSNEGGYHSISNVFHPAAEGAWYRHVQDAALEALAIVEPDWQALGSQTSVDVDADAGHAMMHGWVNASGPFDFNSLHHHGGRSTDRAKWSAVYYVYPGDDRVDSLEGQLPPATEVGTDAGLLGALLFQLQPNPARTVFQLLPIAPVAGCLWVFPAYLPHAVMPRTLLPLGTSAYSYGVDGKVYGTADGMAVARASAQAGEEGVPSEPSLRISVALNIVLTRGPRGAGPKHRKASRRERQRLMLESQADVYQPFMYGSSSTSSSIEDPCPCWGSAVISSVSSCVLGAASRLKPFLFAPSHAPTDVSAEQEAEQEADPLI